MKRCKHIWEDKQFCGIHICLKCSCIKAVHKHVEYPEGYSGRSIVITTSKYYDNSGKAYWTKIHRRIL